MNGTAEPNTTEVLLNFGRPHSQVMAGCKSGLTHKRTWPILPRIDPEIGKIMLY